MATIYTDYNYSLLTGLIQNHAFWTSPMCFRQDNGPASKKLQCQWYYILTSRTVDNAYISADWWIRELHPILDPVHIMPQKFHNATYLYGQAYHPHLSKTEFFDNDGFSKFLWFVCSSFPQTQIQNERWWFLRLQTPRAWCEQKSFIMLSQWELCFQIALA